MTRRLIGIVAAIVLATIGTLVLVTYVRTAEDRALAGEATVEVLVVKKEIPRGTPAESLEGMVASEKIPAKVQAAGSVASLQGLEGKVASVALLPGEQIVTQRFIAPQGLGAVEVPEGLLQVTVQLEPQRALGGQIAAGDTVGVVSSFKDGQEDDDQDPSETTHLSLHKVLVTRVQSADGTGAAPNGEQPQGEAAAPAGNLLITLAVDAPSVERIVFAAEHGTLWLSAEPESAPEGGTRIQTMETIYQ